MAHSCTMIIQFDVCCYMIPLANMDVSFITSHNCYSVFGKFGVVVNSFLVLSKISDCGF